MFLPFRSTGFVFALSLAWVLTITSETAAQATDAVQTAEVVDLAQIAAKLSAYFGSLDTIEVEYTQTPIDGGEYQLVTHWRWMQSGPRKLLSLNSEPGGAGVKVPHGWFSFDGEHAYSVIVDLDAPQQILRIYQSETMDQMYEEVPNPFNFLGHPLMRTQARLVELLPQSTATGYEMIEGVKCLRIECPPIRTTGGDEAATFWLDPGEGYLPRRYFQREPGLREVRDAGPASAYFVLDFDEFQNVRDEVLGEERRFLKTARMTGAGGVHRYDFTRVRINHRPERVRFQPQAQVGTEMIVRRAGQPEVMTVYGGRAGVAKRQAENLQLVQKITEERQAAAKEAASKGTPADARPPASSRLWIVSAALCAVLLVGILWWARVRG
jgi:hypothetical protein